MLHRNRSLHVFLSSKFDFSFFLFKMDSIGHQRRVSFSSSSVTAHDEITEYIKEEAEKRPVQCNLANRNLVRLPSEIGLLQDLERYFGGMF